MLSTHSTSDDVNRGVPSLCQIDSSEIKASYNPVLEGYCRSFARRIRMTNFRINSLQSQSRKQQHQGRYVHSAQSDFPFLSMKHENMFVIE